MKLGGVDSVSRVDLDVFAACPVRVNHDWVGSRRYSPEDRTPLKADIVSMPAGTPRMLVVLSNEEYDHANQ